MTADRRRRGPLRATITRELGRSRRGLAVAAAATIGFMAAELLVPWPIKVVFDQILLDKPVPGLLGWLQPVLDRGDTFALAVVASSMVAIAFVRGVFSYGQLYVTSKIGLQVARAIQREVFAHLQRLPLAFHSRSRSGELLTRMTSDTNALRDAFGNYLVPSVGDSLTLVGMFVVMLLLDWRLALVPLASFPVLYVALRLLYRRTKASASSQRKGEGRIAARLGELLTAVSLVQAYGRERYENDRLAAETAETLALSVRTARLEAANSRSVEAVSATAIAAVVVVGALRVGSGAVSPGELLVFTGYLTQMYKPVRSLAKVSTRLSKAAVSAERIGEVLGREPEIRDAPDATALVTVRGAIGFDDVRFGYDGEEVLRGVTFHAAPGERIALVGPSGAGKSTIASMLLRFYDATAGAVTIDGRDVRRITLASLRGHIAVVPQESLLFGTTVRENIAYGNSEAGEERIIAAARAANAHEFITGLPDGYETVLGERGGTLSGGQRRRIAIARAIVRDAPILILDEPMTGLDVASEASVREALDRLMAGRTCLTITHDMHAVADADRVLLLQDGRIADQGSHAELMARNRSYSRLVELRGRPPHIEPARRLQPSWLARGARAYRGR